MKSKFITVSIDESFEVSSYNIDTAYCKWHLAKQAGNEREAENNARIYYALREAMGLPYKELKLLELS